MWHKYSFPRVGVGTWARLVMATGFANRGPEFVHKVWVRVEEAAANGITGEHAQPALHLIQPRGVGGGEGKMHVGVLLLPVAHERSLMHRQIVEDDVGGFSAMSSHGLVQEL